MTARFLAWYTASALGLVWVALSAVTVHPDAVSQVRTLQIVVVSVAGVFLFVAIALQLLPDAHWCNQSRRVRIAMSVVAAAVSLLLLTCVG